jgi:HD-like signal output (HDOD) protein
MNRLEVGAALPPLSPDLAQMFVWLSTPQWQNHSAAIAEILQRESLAEPLWRNLRSPFFAFAPESQNLQELLEVESSKTIGALLIAFLLRRLLPAQLGRAKSFDREKQGRHNMGTAVGAKLLAAKTKIGDPNRLFAYGLIHDLGITVLDICLPELLDEICHVQSRGSHRVVAEKEILAGLTHEELGGWLCEKWKLPLDIQAIVKYHHRPLLATIGVDEIKLLYLADMLSAESYDELIGLKLSSPLEATVRGHLGITADGLALVRQQMQGAAEEANQLLVL